MLHELLDQLTAGHEVVTPAELVLLRADGSKRWLEVRASNLMDDPNVRGIVLNGRDVTERRAYQDALTYEATHDRLTELPNRAQFLHILGRAEERAIGEGRSLAVLFVDIDHFKVVNDSLGHGVGDALLVAVARRLVGAVRASDPVARLGGDEFVVVCEGVDLAGAKMVAQHVLAVCAAPFEIAGASSASPRASASRSLSTPTSQPRSSSATPTSRCTKRSPPDVRVSACSTTTPGLTSFAASTPSMPCTRRSSAAS